VAAAVGPAVAYVRVTAPLGGRDLVLAAARVGAVLGDDAEVRGPVPVDELVGAHYERPFTQLALGGSGARVVVADFVTVDDGSGIVHLAPAFGEVDREVADTNGLPALNPVGPAATFVDGPAGSTPWTGMSVKDADPAIIEALDAEGRLVSVVDYAHSYPHCWRCGTPLVYWAKPTWFARTSAHKDRMLAENEAIGWHPEYIRHGRFGDWLENNVDWALSRDRFWGTPLPVWRCGDCGTDTCVGSVAELSERARRDLSELDLHRPAVDDVVLDCPGCAANGTRGTARRVEPVLDAWFDSGAMPAAQFRYPFGDADRLFERRFPADFICEAIDQTRGWFYSLLAVNTLAFGRSPYRNVVCLALVVDKDGQKMSKSRGNVIDPWSVLDTRGADALRWNFFSSGSPWTPRRVSIEAVDESARFLVTLWNTYSFFVTYANLDGFTPEERVDSGHVVDRWVRSRLDATVGTVTSALDDFDALRAAQALEAFVDDLSNWYVRRSRPRFWEADDDAAHSTLHDCLVVLAKLLAPFCPFVADEMYRNLAATSESVHLTDWPTPPGGRDEALEAEMADARTVVSLGLAARNDAKLKVRRPLRRAFVLLPAGGAFSGPVAAEVADALNVKSLEFVADLEGLLDYSVVPNFRSLGPRAGARTPLVKEALATAGGATIRGALERVGRYELTLGDGSTFPLEPGDVDVRAASHEELALAQESGFAVALDTTPDDELVAEGLARDVIRLLNEARKSEGFEIADRVRVELACTGELRAAVHRHRDWIAREVLAVEFTLVDEAPGAFARARVSDVDGEALAVRLTRA
jgi:isoleucyl-tRNA synthetase